MSHHLDIFLLFLLSRPLREKRFRISHLSSLFYICFYHIFSPFRRNKMSSSSINVGRLRSSSGFVGCCRCFSTSAKSRLRHQRRSTGKINEIYGDVSRSWTSRKSLRMPLKDWKKDENEAKSFASYVSDGSRILSVTFPDENRRTRIDENTWKVELLPFDFLGNKVAVESDGRVDPKSNR